MPNSVTTGNIPASARSTHRVATQRQRRVVRDVAVFVVTTLGLVLIVSANRDKQAVDDCRNQMQFAASSLMADVAANHALPLALPLNPKLRNDRTHYNYAPASLAVAMSDRPVALIYCTAPHSLITRSAGRHVAIKRGRAIEVVWMTEAEFQARAAELGCRSEPP